MLDEYAGHVGERGNEHVDRQRERLDDDDFCKLDVPNGGDGRCSRPLGGCIDRAPPVAEEQPGSRRGGDDHDDEDQPVGGTMRLEARGSSRQRLRRPEQVRASPPSPGRERRRRLRAARAATPRGGQPSSGLVVMTLPASSHGTPIAEATRVNSCGSARDFTAAPVHSSGRQLLSKGPTGVGTRADRRCGPVRTFRPGLLRCTRWANWATRRRRSAAVRCA